MFNITHQEKKCFLIIMIFSTLFCFVPFLFGQNVMETQKPNFTEKQQKEMKKLLLLNPEKLNKEEVNQKIDFLKKKLDESENLYEQYNIIFMLSFLYATAKDYENCLEVLKTGQKQGFIFPAMTNGYTWPEYLTELKKLKDFDIYLQENKRIKNEARKNATAEYFVQTPKNYSKENQYPLLIVLHGGAGNNINNLLIWQSQKLKSEYIVVYFQGSKIQGSFSRSYSFDKNEWMNAIKEIYKQTKQKYPIDTTKIIVGGPSAGGMRAATCAFEQIIPVSGLLLAFPVKPHDLDTAKVLNAAKSGLKAVILTGENDQTFLRGQKEMSVVFDKSQLENRLVIYPSLGHEYPNDFSEQIDISLEFIHSKKQ